MPHDGAGQLEAVMALYWAVLGTVAAVDYLTGFHILSDGLGLGSAPLFVLNLVWFVTLVRGLPRHLEVAFGG